MLSRSRLVLVALAVAAPAALSACGGSSTTTITASPPATTASTSVPVPTTSTSTASTSTSASAAKQAFESALKDNLLNKQNLSSAQAKCVLQKIDQSVTEAEIQQVVQGSFPQSLAKKAAQAGGTCALQNP